MRQTSRYEEITGLRYGPRLSGRGEGKGVIGIRIRERREGKEKKLSG